MFKVSWDIKNNGILLDDTIDNLNVITRPPRPVYHEELDLLEFYKHWRYPKSKYPLLWAVGRRYYYKGTWVAETKGGNIFDAPEVIIKDEGINLELKPINIKKLIEKNQNALFVLENEAMDFVEDTFNKYKKGQTKARRKKVDFFIVAFSGGKDSQVILDIVSRVLHPDDYMVIFADTQMEIPPTYEIVEETKKQYQKLYPNLKFEIASSEQNIVDLWKEFGPPSRIHRWCCSVAKTVPFAKLPRAIYTKNKQPNILVFDGVRSNESTRREGYNRIEKGKKHCFQINAEVIRNWNTIEVFLYLFYRNVKVNQGYREGLARVGCSVCPFSSFWSEFILNKSYKELTDKYLKIIHKYITSLGIKDENEINKYIKQGQWKKRAGGIGIDEKGSRIDFISEKPYLKSVITKPKENFFEWIKTTGNISNKKLNGKSYGEIRGKDCIFNFEVNKNTITVSNTYRDTIFLSKVKRVLYKTTYCIHCGACEVECSTGALKISLNKIHINEKLCNHCGNCLNFEDRGCLVAKSLYVSNIGGGKMDNKLSGFHKYETFGIRKEWLTTFLYELDNWLANNKLGNRQINSMIAWMRDAELITQASTREKKVTNLCKLLSEIYQKDELLVWQIIWINLYYHSTLIKWYVDDLSFYKKYLINEQFREEISNKYDGISIRTIKNGLTSLLNMFENSPFGEELKFGVIEKEKNIRFVTKIGTDNIHPITIAYYLYKNAEEKERYGFTISEFYEDINSFDYEDLMNKCDKDTQKAGPYRLFGLSRPKFEAILVYLQENKNEIVRVDLKGGLDNIHLKEDLDCEKILKYF